jgi:phage replication O-like protein O
MKPDEDYKNNPYLPNTASIPNILFDYWMAKLSPGEFKVLMAIARKTYGWHKQKDRISLRQLTEMTGLHKSGVIKATESLIEVGLVTKIKSKGEYGDEPNQYEINVDMHKKGGGCPPSGQGGVHTVDTGGVHTVDTQNPLLTKPNITKEYTSGPAVGLTNFFFEKLKEMNPKIKPPNLIKWTQQISNMLKHDLCTEQEVRQVIDFIVEQHKNPKNEFTWSKAVISPEKLRKHFPTIWMAVNTKSPEKMKEEVENQKVETLKSNRIWAKILYTQVLPQLNKMEHNINYRTSETCVTLEDKRTKAYHTLGYAENGFRHQVEKFLKSKGVL